MWWLYDAVVSSYFVIALVEIMGVVVLVEFNIRYCALILMVCGKFRDTGKHRIKKLGSPITIIGV